MILGCKLNTLDVMNSSRMWIMGTTLGCELRALDVVNSSGQWIT